jgi:hypothetical protein
MEIDMVVLALIITLHLFYRVICTGHAVNCQGKNLEFEILTNWISSPVAYLLSHPSKSFSIADWIQRKVREGQHKMQQTIREQE